MVICKRCRDRLATLQSDGVSATAHFGVGKRSRDENGHAVFFNRDGQIALCEVSLLRRGTR